MKTLHKSEMRTATKIVRPVFEPVTVEIRRTVLPCGICGSPINARDVRGKPKLYHMDCLESVMQHMRKKRLEI